MFSKPIKALPADLADLRPSTVLQPPPTRPPRLPSSGEQGNERSSPLPLCLRGEVSLSGRRRAPPEKHPHLGQEQPGHHNRKTRREREHILIHPAHVHVEGACQKDPGRNNVHSELKPPSPALPHRHAVDSEKIHNGGKNENRGRDLQALDLRGGILRA